MKLSTDDLTDFLQIPFSKTFIYFEVDYVMVAILYFSPGHSYGCNFACLFFVSFFVYTRFNVPFIIRLIFLREWKTLIFKNNPRFWFLAVLDGLPLEEQLGNGRQYLSVCL